MTVRRFYENSGLNVATYDARAERDARRFGDHMPFYREQALLSGGPVLDIGSGTGRVAFACAAAGIETVGLEPSAGMLEQASHVRSSAPPDIRDRVRFLPGDMRDFDLGFPFALVMVPHRGFQHLLTRPEQVRALERIKAHMGPGARLALDLFDPRPEDVSRAVDNEPVTLPPVALQGGFTAGIEILERTNDAATQTLTEHWRFTATDAAGETVAVEDERLTLRWTWRDEMRDLLLGCGYTVLKEWSDFKGSPPGRGREQVWLARVAEV